MVTLKKYLKANSKTVIKNYKMNVLNGDMTLKHFIKIHVKHINDMLIKGYITSSKLITFNDYKKYLNDIK